MEAVKRVAVAPFTSRVGNRFVAEWREDGKWWTCTHKHRGEFAAEACGRRVRKTRTTEVRDDR